MKLKETDTGMLSLLVQHNQIPKWHISCISCLLSVGLSVFLMLVKKKKKGKNQPLCLVSYSSHQWK